MTFNLQAFIIGYTVLATIIILYQNAFILDYRCTITQTFIAAVVAGEPMKNFVLWIADQLKKDSSSHYCPNGDEGSYDAYQGSEPVTIYTKMWASGRNCDTIAERDTIAGSMWKLFEDKYKNGDSYIKLPEAGCLSGNHGGTYNTFLPFGTNKDKVYAQDCVNQKFPECVSGGENDLK
uniref:ARAD1B00198p n=1 Tax=Blastobotrys adeninivorans TaxID=409370 RepID=A0A060T4Z9_BLAAD